MDLSHGFDEKWGYNMSLSDTVFIFFLLYPALKSNFKTNNKLNSKELMLTNKIILNIKIK